MELSATDHCHVPGDRHTVARAGQADADTIAALLADAFVGYPWTDWVVPHDGRRERLRRLHHLTLARVGFPYGSVWAARCPLTDRPIGAVVVLRPDRPVPGEVWSLMVPAEAELMADRHEAAVAAEAAVADLRPTQPAVMVATLGVAPEHRRRGIARLLLLPALAVADRLGVPAYLETSSRPNVRLYTSVGFEVAAHRTVAEQGPDVWAMHRPPRFAGAEP